MKNNILVLSFILILLFPACDSIFSPKVGSCHIEGNITVQTDFEGDIKFLGEIINNGDGKALFVKITFTMKDAGGGVIGTDFTFVTSTDLDPGQKSSFECWTETARAQVKSWEYEITWENE